jgi:hypothetical protein
MVHGELFYDEREDCFHSSHLVIISILLICVEYYGSRTETKHSPSIKCAPYLFSEVSTPHCVVECDVKICKTNSC